MWKTILSLCALLITLTFCYKSIQQSHAQQGPNTATGHNPIINFYGNVQVSPNQGTTILHNTSGQDLIITSALVNNDYCALAIDGNPIFPDSYTTGMNIFRYNNGLMSVFKSGSAKLKVPQGSELQWHTSYTSTRTCYYYIEGHYVHQ